MTVLVGDSTLTDYAWNDVLVSGDSTLTEDDFYTYVTVSYLARKYAVHGASGSSSPLRADAALTRRYPRVYAASARRKKGRRR